MRFLPILLAAGTTVGKNLGSKYLLEYHDPLEPNNVRATLQASKHFDVSFHKATKWEYVGEIRQHVKERFRDDGIPDEWLLDKFYEARLYGGYENSDYTDYE
ncbi:hypothetical protein H9P43_009649 [Blastocladiella emersonii ATCC 22665]|nr:hypothetical protein H9P43_009649 [Blastocladiella emersonii ATCC 22665]